MVGHGQTNNDLESGELFRGVVLKVANFADCVSTWKDNTEPMTITSNMLCLSTATGQSSCNVCKRIKSKYFG